MRHSIGLVGLVVTAALGYQSGSALAEQATVVVMTTETNPATQAVFEEAANSFEKQNPDVDVQFQYVGFQDFNQKLMQAVAAGAPPQMFTVGNQYDLFKLAQQGVIRPVDDIIDLIGRDDYFPKFLAADEMEGKTWGVPFSVGVNVLWYRRDLYDQNGLKEAKTWDEYLHNVQVLDEAGKKAEGGRYYGIALAVGNNYVTNDNTQNWMWSNGALVYDSAGKPVLDSPESVATFEYLSQLAKYTPPGVATYSNTEMQNSFATGAVAHTEYPFRLLSLMQGSNPALLDVAMPMLHPVGNGPDAHPSSLIYGKSWAVAKDAPFQEQTVKFIKFLETGDTKIAVMKTVPVHYWPPIKSVANDPSFLDQPLLQTPAGKRSLEVLAEAVEVGQFPVTESGVPVLAAGEALGKRVLAATLEKIVVAGANPAEAVKQSADELK